MEKPRNRLKHFQAIKRTNIRTRRPIGSRVNHASSTRRSNEGEVIFRNERRVSFKTLFAGFLRSVLGSVFQRIEKDKIQTERHQMEPNRLFRECMYSQQGTLTEDRYNWSQIATLWGRRRFGQMLHEWENVLRVVESTTWELHISNSGSQMAHLRYWPNQTNEMLGNNSNNKPNALGLYDNEREAGYRVSPESKGSKLPTNFGFWEARIVLSSGLR